MTARGVVILNAVKDLAPAKPCPRAERRNLASTVEPRLQASSFAKAAQDDGGKGEKWESALVAAEKVACPLFSSCHPERSEGSCIGGGVVILNAVKDLAPAKPCPRAERRNLAFTVEPRLQASSFA
jgi:hypothetical protein